MPTAKCMTGNDEARHSWSAAKAYVTREGYPTMTAPFLPEVLRLLVTVTPDVNDVKGAGDLSAPTARTLRIRVLSGTT